jgi:hypothetical protein
MANVAVTANVEVSKAVLSQHRRVAFVTRRIHNGEAGSATGNVNGNRR